MKNILLLSLTLLLNTSLFGQTKVDQFISISIPGDLLKTDTIIRNIPFLQYRSTDGIETYLMHRIQVDLDEASSDLASLKTNYEAFTQGQISSMEAAGFALESSTEFKIGNYIAYKLRFNNAESGVQNAESNVLLLNRNAYVASYINHTNFNNSNKNVFLNSLTISNAPKQIIGKSAAYKFGFIFGKVFFFAVFIFVIIFVIKTIIKK